MYPPKRRLSYSHVTTSPSRSTRVRVAGRGAASKQGLLAALARGRRPLEALLGVRTAELEHVVVVAACKGNRRAEWLTARGRMGEAPPRVGEQAQSGRLHPGSACRDAMPSRERTTAPAFMSEEPMPMPI